jgi:hypothetical protein
MVPSLYTERALQGIWERQAFRREGLLTEDARPLAVEFPGIRSVEGGPDFRAARIVLGGSRRVGDVEIHLLASGWRAHGHDRDGAYSGVVLHVVLRRASAGEEAQGPAPVLVLEPYLSAGEAPGRAELRGDLDALGEAWFAERRARLLRRIEREPADEVLYREILVALGYKHNKASMAELARRIPLGALAGSAGEIEAALRRAAESMPAGMWRLRNVRPANHPWRRLAGMARFLAAARGEGLAAGLAARPSLESMTSWLDPDGTGQIGRSRALEVALNVFVPYLGGEAWRAARERPAPARPGAVERQVGARAATVRRYFGALRLMGRHEFSLPPPGEGARLFESARMGGGSLR